MASRKEWGEAYLAQAASDLAAAQALGGAEPSVLAMLLQMTFEKAAKGILLLGKMIDVDKATSTHAAAGILVNHLKRSPELLSVLGAGTPYAYKQVLSLVYELERLNPALVRASGQGGPQLEYPWEEANTQRIQWPASDLPIGKRLADPRSREVSQLLHFARALITHGHALVD